MARASYISGIDKIIGNLKKTDTQIARGIARGLKRGGTLLQRASQEIVPVHKGPLKASAFTRNIGSSGFKTHILVGYTANYAVYVHEDLEKAHGEAFNRRHAEQIASATTSAQKRYFFNRGINQQAKFLEQPARELKSTILKIIHQEAKK